MNSIEENIVVKELVSVINNVTKINFLLIKKDTCDVIGATIISFINTYAPVISDVFVEEEYRFLGLGTKMLEASYDYIRKHGKSEYVYLYVDPNDGGVVNMYKKMGYKILNDRTPEGHEWMVKSIK